MQDNTCENDVKTFLRFLGWISSHDIYKGFRLDFSVFMHEEARSAMDDFVLWLKDVRSLAYSSIARQTHTHTLQVMHATNS